MALRALSFDPTKQELNELIKKYDTNNTGRIDFHEFLNIMLYKMSESNSDSQIQAAFELFDLNGDKYIDMEDLKRVAAELGEKMSEEELQEMLSGASRKGGEDEGRITQTDFINILKTSTQ